MYFPKLSVHIVLTLPKDSSRKQGLESIFCAISQATKPLRKWPLMGSCQELETEDFPNGPMVKNLPCNSEEEGSVKIPQGSGQVEFG